MLDLIVTGVGGLLAVLGSGICVYWYVWWRQNFTGELITHGMYAQVRHPLYSGFLALTIGLALAVPMYETRFLLVIALAVISVYIPKEEEALVIRYRRKYREYMGKVPYRLIPRVY